MASKLILFNGPRHSGKDTAALFCEKNFCAHHIKFSAPIKAAIKAMFSLSDEQVEYLESIKTKPDPLLFGKSYVEVQISFSEMWAKQLFGQYVFGALTDRVVERTIRKYEPLHAKVGDHPGVFCGDLFVCSDSGFDYEAAPVVRRIGTSNCLLVRIFREGKTYAGDSRDYISLPGVKTVDVYNNGEIHEYYDEVEGLVEAFVADRLA